MSEYTYYTNGIAFWRVTPQGGLETRFSPNPAKWGQSVFKDADDLLKTGCLTHWGYREIHRCDEQGNRITEPAPEVNNPASTDTATTQLFVNRLKTLHWNATPAPWYENNQEHDSRVMLTTGSFIGQFDDPADCKLACDMRTMLPNLIAHLEALAKDNNRMYVTGSRLVQWAVAADEDNRNLRKVCSELRTRLLAFISATADITDCSADLDAVNRADDLLNHTALVPKPPGTVFPITPKL